MSIYSIILSIHGPLAWLVERADASARSGDNIKYFVYILLLSNNQYYIGSTNNIERRIDEHNTGHTASIKYKLPAKLIFSQQFATLKEARQVEYRVKKQKSRKFIEEILKRDTIVI